MLEKDKLLSYLSLLGSGVDSSSITIIIISSRFATTFLWFNIQCTTWKWRQLQQSERKGRCGKRKQNYKLPYCNWVLQWPPRARPHNHYVRHRHLCEICDQVYCYLVLIDNLQRIVSIEKHDGKCSRGGLRVASTVYHVLTYYNLKETKKNFARLFEKVL